MVTFEYIRIKVCNLHIIFGIPVGLVSAQMSFGGTVRKGSTRTVANYVVLLPTKWNLFIIKVKLHMSFEHLKF